MKFCRWPRPYGWGVFSLLLLLALGGLWWQHQQNVLQRVSLQALKTALNHVFQGKFVGWPQEIEVDRKKLSVLYTFDEDLTHFIQKKLADYRSDYAAVSVIDNESGKILSVVGHQKEGNQINMALAFSSTHPSASLIKIVTAAGLLQRSPLTPQSKIAYNGRRTTLYKYQLQDRWNPWTREQSLAEAFACSNNVIFGKAALHYLPGNSMYELAAQFGFNQDLMQEVNLSRSNFPLPENQYHLAELASGFNKQTSISPIHAAVLAAAVANDGVMPYPFMAERMMVGGKELWKAKPRMKRVLAAQPALRLKKMMQETVDRGTARGSFRQMASMIKDQFIIGGKTGSITGGLPAGRHDWFTAFVIPRDARFGKGISISVLNVNVEKWRVRSTYLAKSIIEYYFQEQRSTAAQVGHTTSGKDDRHG
ncbi:MAG: hypothetical protein J6Y94_02890 [Bacteriovoracaceae bacterium]|nr:hypothetical protein [Bacteriovoracaceae bacterium]